MRLPSAVNSHSLNSARSGHSFPASPTADPLRIYMFGIEGAYCRMNGARNHPGLIITSSNARTGRDSI